jgi:hypothetical protein
MKTDLYFFQSDNVYPAVMGEMIQLQSQLEIHNINGLLWEHRQN